MEPETRSATNPTTARDHLSQVIAEFGADSPERRDVLVDLTGDEVVLDLTDREPTPARPIPTRLTDASPPAVVAPVLNRARYRRRGVAGVSTRPGELSELATLAESPPPPVATTSTDPDVLSLVLAAQRRPRRPVGSPEGDPSLRHPSSHRPAITRPELVSAPVSTVGRLPNPPAAPMLPIAFPAPLTMAEDTATNLPIAEPSASPSTAPTLPLGLADPVREDDADPAPHSMTAALDAILEAVRLPNPPAPAMATALPAPRAIDALLFPDHSIATAGPLRVPLGDGAAATTAPAPAFVATPVDDRSWPQLAPPA